MDKAERFWDRTASSYDQEEKKDAQIYSQIIERTKKHLKSSDMVLDFGCGTGLVSNEIADHVRAIQGIDISSNMIELARKKADTRGITNIDYVHATLFDGRYQINSFDVILAFYVLHLLEDTPEMMGRIHTLLKPGGLFISTTPCIGEKKSFQSALLRMFSKTGLVPRIKSFKIAELKAAVAQSGFDMVEADCLQQSAQQYFIVARKIERP